ncbi:hypothetical protein BDZ97DRAFT_1733622, partial [Flammula alnicola]
MLDTCRYRDNSHISNAVCQWWHTPGPVRSFRDAVDQASSVVLAAQRQSRKSIFLSPVTLASAVLVGFGAALRYLCYREMGRHFTYSIILVENHKLVTTGPYSVVRHPSYTGATCVYIGVFLWHFAPGSWLRESGFYKETAAWL